MTCQRGCDRRSATECALAGADPSCACRCHAVADKPNRFAPLAPEPPTVCWSAMVASIIREAATLLPESGAITVVERRTVV
jgi:hypothetical protein